MGNPTRQVASGDPIRIDPKVWNLFNQTARAHQRDRNQGRAGVFSYHPEGLVYIQNNSGADRQRFEVLGLDDILIDPADDLLKFQNYPAFVGVTPTSDHIGYFGICAQAIKKDEVGLAFIFGTCACGINVTNDHHEFADVKVGDATQLQSAEAQSAAQILWKEPGTGSVNAIIRLGNKLATREAALRITSTAGGSAYGKYNGYVLGSPTSDVSPSTAVTDADLGVNAGDPVLIINSRETMAGHARWDLDPAGTTFFPIVFVGFHIKTNSDGTLVFMIDGRQGEPCG